MINRERSSGSRKRAVSGHDSRKGDDESDK